MADGRVAARFAIAAAWGLVMFALVCGGGLLGLELGIPLGARWLAVVGVVAAVVVCRRLRWWIQRIRLRGMGSGAITVTATVRQLDYWRTSGRPPNRTVYTVWFAWTGSDGAEQVRERQYGFVAAGVRAFEVCVAEGNRIAIRHPAGRPDRFIADIPYSAAMADQLI